MFLQIAPFSPVCIATEIAILLHWLKWNKSIIPVMVLSLDIMSESFFKEFIIPVTLSGSLQLLQQVSSSHAKNVIY